MLGSQYSSMWSEKVIKSPTFFNIAPSAPRSVKIQEKSATSLVVTWKPPEYPNGIIQRYRILYSNNSGKNYSTADITKGLKNETLFYVISGLKEDTDYRIYVSLVLPCFYYLLQLGVLLLGLAKSILIIFRRAYPFTVSGFNLPCRCKHLQVILERLAVQSLSTN